MVDDNIKEVLQLAGPTGIVAIFLVYWFLKDKPKLDIMRQHIAFHDTVMKRLAKLELQNDDLQKRIGSLECENIALKNKLALMESAHQDLPLPQWLKDERGIVLAVNAAYEELFLRPLGLTSRDYIGHDDYAVWPPEIAKEYRTNDMEVFRTGRVFNSTEKVLSANGIVDWHIIKYVRYAGDVKIGIAGIAIPDRVKVLE